MVSKNFMVLVTMLVAALLFTATIATPIQQLSRQIDPAQGSEMELQQTPTFTKVMIDYIDGDYVGWNDSATHADTDKRPLFIYETPCIMSFISPADAVANDKAAMSFIWCEEDDKSCEASTSVRVGETLIVEHSQNTTMTFSIPHLSWTKYFSSHIQFEIAQTRVDADNNENFISMYKSQYVYPSDIATKATKTVVIVVVVFCCVLVTMALAVLGYMIFKKVKKMRRQRHFPTKEHNLFRRK